ncbi:double-strand break repair protein AddB [Altererythrobacter salegens]|uniref:Double-strand break repair protein AddB n=1 Tax=Croceibacterium salegens TaxID=1737568 RepID=A0A6I4SV88_9SPHN|nr:double-strand break repair protein AddB [Croceibacterium salegens]MXO60084.1 double-strand break repair protein AddB [Croceibacterium salegens]
MADRSGPQVYSIAAHRGFADALVAGLIPRYSEPEVGLARLTLLLPSSRAVRTVSEAFIRLSGAGLLMPRMATVGDLDLDETLGALLDPLGAGAAIPPAADPTRRLFRLAQLAGEEFRGSDDRPLPGAARLRLAKQVATAIDRLLIEDIDPEALWQEPVLQVLADQADHWKENTRLFARVHARWRAELAERSEVDAATRRNRLFALAVERWRSDPPKTSVVAAGVTSAAPALADLLRVVSELPGGAVILPDLDLSMSAEVWDELGHAGAPDADPPLAKGDAVTHPQYHLKLLLNRMGVNRTEVQPWHRAGQGKGPPERSHAISNLFLPPQASKGWVDLPSDKRRLAGVRIVETANPEEEAQAIALLVRQAVEEPEKRVAVVTPDRGLARRVVHHLRRWNIEADDSAGRPLSQTPAGRLFLILAEVAAEQAAPVPLMALLEHPLVRLGDDRGTWLDEVRAFELQLRGPRPAPELEALRELSAEAKVEDWWSEVESILAPLMDEAEAPLSDLLDRLVAAGEALAGENLWAREDGRALSALVEDLRLHAGEAGFALAPAELPFALRDLLEGVAVRPPYGSHPRVAIYGLLEARMTRADLVICAGLNEGTWPATPTLDPLLPSALLRVLGVPGPDFRIGLSAHDLAGMLGAPEVVLSRSARDVQGPTIPSRFLLRVKALLGQRMAGEASDEALLALARALDDADQALQYPQPKPVPSPEQRKVRVSVTALDRLRSDPYQFYASAILRLKQLDLLDAEPTPAWKGTAAHEVLEKWHKTGRPMAEVADEVLTQMNHHPLMRALWRPRLMKALEWVEAQIAANPDRTPALFEEWGSMMVRGVEIFGKADRIDRYADGTLAIVDYKTGQPPSGEQVEQGYALQLGTTGLMAERGGFKGLSGTPEAFEYWSLAKSKKSDSGFGYIATPILTGSKRSGIALEDFLPEAQRYLDEALDKWILGDAPFTARLNPDAPGYDTYDQLMRLDEWLRREDET